MAVYSDELNRRLYGNNFTLTHDCCGAGNDTKCKKDLEANKTSLF